jgi:hypothetical protein
MSIASIGEAIENPSVTQLLAAYPTKDAFDAAVKAGKIKPTTEAGVAANIFNRIVGDALAKQAQAQAQSTVFEEMTASQGTPQMGLAAAQQMPQQMPQRAGQGLDQVPVPENMFDEQRMAGGGIVAFQPGGAVSSPSFAGMYAGVPDLEELYKRQYALQQKILGADPTAQAERERLRGLMAQSEQEKKRRQYESLTKLGLRMLGTKEADFFTALGQAGEETFGEYGTAEQAAREVNEARQKELNRLAGLERTEKAQALEGATGQLRTLEERAYKSAEAEKERVAKAEQSELDRALQKNLTGMTLSNRMQIARMDIGSKEKIANMPPDVIRGAQAIQKPGEDIGDAVNRYTEVTTKATNNNTAKINAYTAMLKSANEQWNEMTGVSGSLRDLADAANGDKKGLEAAKKQFGVSTAEEASKLLESKRQELIAKREADLPFSKPELQRALASEKQPGGTRSLSATPSATGGRKPPQKAIDALMKNPTPDMKKQFEDYYGISADAYLGR